MIMHCLAYVTNDVITKIIPKALKKEFKYRCDELACRKIIRGDKWLLHCKSEHGFKVATSIEIKKHIISVRKNGGAWETATDSTQVCIRLYSHGCVLSVDPSTT